MFRNSILSNRIIKARADGQRTALYLHSMDSVAEAMRTLFSLNCRELIMATCDFNPHVRCADELRILANSTPAPDIKILLGMPAVSNWDNAVNRQGLGDFIGPSGTIARRWRMHDMGENFNITVIDRQSILFWGAPKKMRHYGAIAELHLNYPRLGEHAYKIVKNIWDDEGPWRGPRRPRPRPMNDGPSLVPSLQRHRTLV
jgi:hypothetical protein